jgi:HK97 family phage prohead protease
MDRLFIETKFVTDDAGTVSALAWPFGKADRIGDTIEKGAFRKARFPIPLLFAHDQREPLGSWTAGEEKANGFYLTGKMLVDDVVRAREVRALVKAGAVKGVSIGFRTLKSRRGPEGRIITDLELLEASIVAIPMHPGARVTSAKTGVKAYAIAAALNRATAHFSKG